MKQLSNEEITQRVVEIEQILCDKLNLKENLSEEEISFFYLNIIPYLKHSKNETMTGRPPKTIEEDLDNFIEFVKTIDLSELEIIETIKNFPAIIRMIDEDFYWKYVLMGVVENEDNTLRKTMLITRTRDFQIDLKLLFSRYCLMKKLNYSDITWNSLIKNSSKDFAKIFVKGKYSKPYKIYKTIDELSSDKLRYMFEVDYNFLTNLAQSPINEEIYRGEGVISVQERSK